MWKMTEGRKSQIVLLDERRLDIIIQPKLHSYELLDLVASHFKLREKQYFGLGFVDETNHFAWLQSEKRVLDHDFPKKTGLLVLYFSIRFYVETIGLLRDSQTVELFYLNARQVLFKGPVECDSETVFELAAHVLQATNGDCVSEEQTREELKKLPLIPTCTLREHPSITYCEDRVICNYEKIIGTSRGLAIVNYMTIIENLPTYGIHFYEVKDKKDIPWWLGISPKGIAVYDKDDKKTPRKLFTWKNLENLYYRDRKFSIEVSGPKRDDSNENVSVSRRTFGSASNVDVHFWFAATPQLTKGIWSMAVNQHQFYLDRKQSKSQLLTARSMSEIAADLCRSTTSLPGSLGSDLSRSPSSHSLPSLSNSRYDLTIEQSDSLKAEREMVKALKARKEALEEALAKKTEELKRLCYEEGELTGVLPHDTPPLAPGEQVPTFRRRVGTAFSLSVKNKDEKEEETQLSSDLSKLELEVELQGKITSAALRLASDKTVSKYVRKQRRQSYTKAVGKLKDMEKKLGDMRRQMGKPVPDHHHHHHHHHHHSHHRGQKDGTYHVMNDDDPSSHSPTTTTTNTTTNSPTDLPTTSSHPAVCSLAQESHNEHQLCDRDTVDSCGNSIYSGDCSIASSMDADDHEGSVNYVLHPCKSSNQMRVIKGLGRRVSSQGSSLSASSDLSYSVSDVSERLDRLMDVSLVHGDSCEKILDNSDEEDLEQNDTDKDEDYSVVEAEKHLNRSKHFVFCRRDDRLSPHERRRRDFNRKFMLAKFEEDVLCENDTDSGASSEYCLSEGGADSLKDEDMNFRGFRHREGSTNTLVGRRKQTFISGNRNMAKSHELLRRSCSINEGYKVFEKYCLEDWIDECNDRSNDMIDGGSYVSCESDGTLRRRGLRGKRYLVDSGFDSQKWNSSNMQSSSCDIDSMDKMSTSSQSEEKFHRPPSSSSQSRSGCIPLSFSSSSTSSLVSEIIEKHSHKNDSNNTHQQQRFSSESSQGSRGRSRVALTSCTRPAVDRSPSPVQHRSSSSRSTSVTSVLSASPTQIIVKERTRHIIYARSRTPDMRRTKSNLSTWRRPEAPLVMQEDLEDFDSVFEDEKKNDGVHDTTNEKINQGQTNVLNRFHQMGCNPRVNFPIRRGLSCPSINEELNTTIETIV